MRKSHEQVLAGQKKAGELQDEVRRLSEANQKLEVVVGRRRLLERDQLTAQIQQLSGELAERQKRVVVRNTSPKKILKHSKNFCLRYFLCSKESH